MKTVLFDLDGTLLDTLPDLWSSTNFALKKFGFPAKTAEEIRNFVGNGLKSLIRRSLPEDAGQEVTDAVLREMKAHYALHCHDATARYRGIPELLEALTGQGFRLAIVSNKADPMVQLLRRVYFDRTIPVAVGESDGVARKPAPDMVREALRRLGSSADEACYVGDSEVDLMTAKNAGLPCRLVGWGFRSPEQLFAAGAEHVCASPSELLQELLVLFP